MLSVINVFCCSFSWEASAEKAPVGLVGLVSTTAACACVEKTGTPPRPFVLVDHYFIILCFRIPCKLSFEDRPEGDSFTQLLFSPPGGPSQMTSANGTIRFLLRSSDLKSLSQERAANIPHAAVARLNAISQSMMTNTRDFPIAQDLHRSKLHETHFPLQRHP